MKHLHLLRHAKSSWTDASLDDHERPLAPRGQKAAKKLAKELRRREIEPELVLCSSARRTRETLELIASALGSPVVEIEDGLYAAGCQSLLARLRRVSDGVGSVLVIGHNPGLERLALELAAGAPGSERLEEKFPTGALASFELDARWGELGDVPAALVGYVVPRELA